MLKSEIIERNIINKWTQTREKSVIHMKLKAESQIRQSDSWIHTNKTDMSFCFWLIDTVINASEVFISFLFDLGFDHRL